MYIQSYLELSLHLSINQQTLRFFIFFVCLFFFSFTKHKMQRYIQSDFNTIELSSYLAINHIEIPDLNQFITTVIRFIRFGTHTVQCKPGHFFCTSMTHWHICWLSTHTSQAPQLLKGLVAGLMLSLDKMNLRVSTHTPVGSAGLDLEWSR